MVIAIKKKKKDREREAVRDSKKTHLIQNVKTRNLIFGLHI